MLIHLIVAGLAGWRMASLLNEEDGPWHVFARLRTRLGASKLGRFNADDTDFFPGLFSCMACTTVWTSTIAWFAWYLHPGVPGVIAAMTVALVVESIVKED